VDQDLLCGLLGGGHVVGPFDEFAFLELGAGTDERHEMDRDGSAAASSVLDELVREGVRRMPAEALQAEVDA
jgi:hypothetical protein